MREVLSNGPEAASEVKREADSAGIAKRTLDRARQSLRVISEREGEPGKRGGGKWFWRLPQVAVANLGGWRTKSNTDCTDEENSPYLSQNEDTGLRLATDGGNKGAKDVGTLIEPLSSDLKPGESATLKELRAKRKGRLSVEAVLGELKGETPSRRLLDRYLAEPNETKFEYLAKSVVYALVDLPHSECDKEAWREYAPVVEAALGEWERYEARA